MQKAVFYFFLITKMNFSGTKLAKNEKKYTKVESFWHKYEKNVAKKFISY